MIYWHEKIYLSDEVREKYDEIRTAIDSGRSVRGVYVISIARNKAEQLDIASSFFFQGECELYSPTVVGLAKGKRDANELVAVMAHDAYKRDGKIDFRSYFG